MSQRFENGVVLISAAGGDIEQATAKLVAAGGGIVVAVDMDQDALDSLVDKINAAGDSSPRINKRRAWGMTLVADRFDKVYSSINPAALLRIAIGAYLAAHSQSGVQTSHNA